MNETQLAAQPQIFTRDGLDLRVVVQGGEPWFVATDVCRILGLDNVTEAVRRLDDDEKGLREIETLGGRQQANLVSESGLYTLILRSNKPEARPFRRWVTHDVLPSLRKTGRYGLGAAPVAATAREQALVTELLAAKDQIIAILQSQVKPRKRKTLMTDEERAQIRELWAQGKSTHEIAEAVGRHASGVAYYLRTVGLLQPKPVELRAPAQEVRHDLA